MTVPSATLDWEIRYRLEAFAVSDPLGSGNPFNPNLPASGHITSVFAATTGPYEPSMLAPSGQVAETTPMLSAVYEDRNAQDGQVRFDLYAVSTGQHVTTVTSSTVVSGSTVSAQVPPELLHFDESYDIVARAINASSVSSLFTTTSTVQISHAPPPVLLWDFPDPDVIRDGSTYYAYSTNSTEGTVPIATSSDLAAWSFVGDALLDPNLGSWARPRSQGGQFWAPAVAAVAGGYALYYTADHDSLSVKCIGAAAATTLAALQFDDALGGDPLVCPSLGASSTWPGPGPWTSGGVIDAEHFVDLGGAAYLLWKNDGNHPSGNGDVSLWAKELTAGGLAFVDDSDPVELLAYDPTTWENGQLDLIEQPEMVLRSDTYYLFYSGNTFSNADYATGYAICPDGPREVCVKVTDGPDDPWLAGLSSTHSGAAHLTSSGHGPGAVTFFGDSNGFGGPGGTWMAYHAWPTEEGADSDDSAFRAMHIQKVAFDEQHPPRPDFFYPYQLHRMLDLGDPGDGLSAGFGVNNHLQVVGMGTWNFGSVARAHSWSPNSGWTDWGTFTSNHTEAARVNDRGLFAGVSYSDPNDIDTFRAVPSDLHDVIAELLRIGLGHRNILPGRPPGQASSDVPSSRGSPGSWRPALWHAWGGLTMLFGDNAVEPGSYTAEAYAINDHRTVVGYYCMYITCFERKGFILQANGTLGQVPGLGGNITAPTAINNNGQVAGWATVPGGAERAFTWHPNTGPVDLFDTVPVGHSRALAINDRGQIVGTYLTGPGSSGQVRGFLHDPETGLWDIGNLHPTASTSTTALDINQDGVITGWSVNGDDDIHAYLRPTGDRYGQP